MYGVSELLPACGGCGGKAYFLERVSVRAGDEVAAVAGCAAATLARPRLLRYCWDLGGKEGGVGATRLREGDVPERR